MAARYLGAAVRRVEDPRLLKGAGCYLDDLTLPAGLEAAFVRSTIAHGMIRTVEASAARALPGVHAVYLAEDLGPAATRPMPLAAPHPLLIQPRTQAPLATDEVCYVGQPIALVIADNRYIAEDAAALVVIDYDPLPVIIDCRRALDPAAALAHRGAGHNRAATLTARFGDAAAAFAGATFSVAERIEMQRGGAHSMEGRGVAAMPSPDGMGITLWSSTQAPYMVRRLLAAHLDWDESRIRVIAPDVGGGFGPKAVFYPEEVVIPLAALRLGRPVRWSEDRREHFQATTQQRLQAWDVEVAADAAGRLIAIRGRGVHDAGAFVPYGVLLPLSSLWPFPGPYTLEALDLSLDVVFTNMVPTSPVRGAGRPYANFVIERLIDRVADALGLDRAEIRRRNFIPRDSFPYATGMTYRDGSKVTYDSGDFEACLNEAMHRAGYADFATRRAAAAERGLRRGIGVASYVEDTGAGPFEGVTVRVQPSGRVHAMTSAASQGQGHATIIAQICADALGVSPEFVTVTSADTSALAYGMGTYGSRVAVAAGSSALNAAAAVRAKALRLAASLLQCASDDLTIAEGRVVRRAGPADTGLDLALLAARLAGTPGIPLPDGFAPGLEATDYAPIDATATASGTHIAEVEVDPATGAVAVVAYVVAHDCGNVLNPLLVDGQILGGVVHGIGNALFERMDYDPTGQPLSSNYGEYLLPLATEMPRIDIAHIETPSPHNPLGAKGAGEGGTIPAAAAIISALEDALHGEGARFSKHPVSPEDVIEAIQLGLCVREVFPSSTGPGATLLEIAGG